MQHAHSARTRSVACFCGSPAKATCACSGSYKNAEPKLQAASNGRALDATTRHFMESRFRRDFSDVRVHTDAQANASALNRSARAYTVGSNIVFAEGRYAPQTPDGKRLIAHELTHVAQQRSSPSKRIMEAGVSAETSSRGALEKQAQSNANKIEGGADLAVTRSADSGILQRQAADPATPRTDPDVEAQRLESIDIVRANCMKIRFMAMKFGVAHDAIAGAILWEAIENPYHRSFSRLGPGKVHPTEFIGKSEAQKVEDEKRVPAAADTDARQKRLAQAAWSIVYIAAIMQRHTENYKKIAGVDISDNIGVLCTLYQGGHSEERAKKLADRRKTDPKAQPVAADSMGPWVERNIKFVSGLCLIDESVPSPKGTRTG